MNYEEALKHCIFRFVSGSHAYGTSTPQSDEDIRGCFIAPLKSAFELFQTSFVGQGNLGEKLKGTAHAIEQGDLNSAGEQLRQAMELDQGDLNLAVGTVQKTDSDEELQELRKFMKLAADNNPNILEYLWAERLILQESPIWTKIREKRDLFLSKKAKWTYSGYSVAQLKRIRVHRGYLLNPPKGKPERKDFDLPEGSALPRESQNAILSIPDEYISETAKDVVRKEKSFQQALSDWNAYCRWKKERNPKRQEIEAKYGYDSKHASHLVRLIRQAKEILQEGTIHVYRPDREELLAIRNGAWTYEQLEQYAVDSEKELDVLYKESKLRDKPDHKRISELYREICEEHHHIKLG
jgi:predicted nucleotidyltransferase